jgi:hypothetical protein
MKRLKSLFSQPQKENEGVDLYKEQLDLETSKLIPRWFWKNTDLTMDKGLLYDVVKDDK